MNDLSFDEWFDSFTSICDSLGYEGPIDKYSFDWNWEEGETPEKSANDFVNEMNE